MQMQTVGRGVWLYSVIAYIVKNVFSTLTSVRKSDLIVMLARNRKSSTKIVNFLTSGVWFLT